MYLWHARNTYRFALLTSRPTLARPRRFTHIGNSASHLNARVSVSACLVSGTCDEVGRRLLDASLPTHSDAVRAHPAGFVISWQLQVLGTGTDHSLDAREDEALGVYSQHVPRAPLPSLQLQLLKQSV